ncbi:3,4-dihydroxy-2-butanone-4-phosphate synthase [Coraliomargarita sp. W4R53]
MNQLEQVFGNSEERLAKALVALQNGGGLLVVDDEDRENEGDLIFAAETLTEAQMATLIRECSGIVCLCLRGEQVERLGLPMMVPQNRSRYQTAFTASIEASQGTTTGVSARDRAHTVRVAANPLAEPSDIVSPGHVFPLFAKDGGVLERRGHTEATVDLMRLAGLQPSGVLCELTNKDGTMARLPEIIDFARSSGYPVVTVEDVVRARKLAEINAAPA